MSFCYEHDPQTLGQKATVSRDVSATAGESDPLTLCEVTYSFVMLVTVYATTSRDKILSVLTSANAVCISVLFICFSRAP